MSHRRAPSRWLRQVIATRPPQVPTKVSSLWRSATPPQSDARHAGAHRASDARQARRNSTRRAHHTRRTRAPLTKPSLSPRTFVLARAAAAAAARRPPPCREILFCPPHAHLALGTSITRPAAPTRPPSASRAPALPRPAPSAAHRRIPPAPARRRNDGDAHAGREEQDPRDARGQAVGEDDRRGARDDRRGRRGAPPAQGAAALRPASRHPPPRRPPLRPRPFRRRSRPS